jgi:superoxide dismutase, Fe-Mn family
MEHILPPLPYAFDALEPYIDARTMEIHHDRHHKAYVDNLNAALAKHPDLQQVSIMELLWNLESIPEDIQLAVRNNGGGHYNHSFFWQIMKKNGGGKPKGKIAEEIQKAFGNFEAFQDQFNTAAKSVFGSGWAWLVLDSEGNPIITTTPNQDVPLYDGDIPVLGLDVWEHAYYLKYQNKRVDYIQAWWHVIDWDMVEENYRAAV